MGSASGSSGGSSPRESGNYNRMDSSLNGSTPNQTRGQRSGSTGSSLGLTTSSTMRGNTAFGPAGGMAAGYATKSPTSGRIDSGSSSFGNPASGGSFGQGTYSNFRNPSGGSMFGSGPGAPGGQGVTARNAIQALMMAQALQQRVRPAAGPGPGMKPPGLLDDEVVVGPDGLPAPPTVPSIPPNIWPGAGAWFEGVNWSNRFNAMPQPPGSYPAYSGGAFGPRGLPTKGFTGAYGDSFYNNAQLGTPGFSSGLGGYGTGGKTNFGGGIPGFSANGNLGTSFGPNNSKRNSFGYNGR